MASRSCPTFAELREQGVGFVAFSPMVNGLLTTTYSSASSFGKGDRRSAIPRFEKGAHEENAGTARALRGVAAALEAVHQPEDRPYATVPGLTFYLPLLFEMSLLSVPLFRLRPPRIDVVASMRGGSLFFTG